MEFAYLCFVFFFIIFCDPKNKTDVNQTDDSHQYKSYEWLFIPAVVQVQNEKYMNMYA